MNFKFIEDNIIEIKKQVCVFEENDFSDVKPCIDVFEFNQIVEKAKHKIQNSSHESDFFKNMFNTDDYYSSISMNLHRVQVSLETKIEKSGVNPVANIKMQKTMRAISDMIDILAMEHNNSIKNDKNKIFSSEKSKRDKIKNLINELVELKKRIEKVIHNDSKVVSNVVLSDFKTIFTFFSNCIMIAKSRSDELLLIEIASISDNIMDMIKPIFADSRLGIDDLIYYYLFYELRELKASAIGDKLAG